MTVNGVDGPVVLDNGVPETTVDLLYGVVESGLDLLVCFVVASAAHVQLFSPPI